MLGPAGGSATTSCCHGSGRYSTSSPAAAPAAAGHAKTARLRQATQHRRTARRQNGNVTVADQEHRDAAGARPPGLPGSAVANVAVRMGATRARAARRAAAAPASAARHRPPTGCPAGRPASGRPAAPRAASDVRLHIHAVNDDLTAHVRDGRADVIAQPDARAAGRDHESASLWARPAARSGRESGSRRDRRRGRPERDEPGRQLRPERVAGPAGRRSAARDQLVAEDEHVDRRSRRDQQAVVPGGSREPDGGRCHDGAGRQQHVAAAGFFPGAADVLAGQGAGPGPAMRTPTASRTDRSTFSTASAPSGTTPPVAMAAHSPRPSSRPSSRPPGGQVRDDSPRR